EIFKVHQDYPEARLGTVFNGKQETSVSNQIFRPNRAFWAGLSVPHAAIGGDLVNTKYFSWF
ncbi:MAG: hypothetical protein P8Y12_07165, partial [Gammaproteobacteria bacterium]